MLEITPQRYGFLRLAGLSPSEDDVYISASQVRRCELRPGDEVSGPAREPRRGERHRALVHVDRVNGEEPLADRPEFDALTPIPPKRRIALDRAGSDVLTRAVDLLAPLAFGQRVLVRAAPRSGRTTLLRGIARAIAANEGTRADRAADRRAPRGGDGLARGAARRRVRHRDRRPGARRAGPARRARARAGPAARRGRRRRGADRRLALAARGRRRRAPPRSSACSAPGETWPAAAR